MLVVTAAIARRYDQTFILENPWWPVGSLLLSLAASMFIYAFIYPLVLRRQPSGPAPGFWRQYVAFLPLFWLTAPVAWLYAFPAERLFSSRTAAIVNLTLLAIVSAWRVALLTRALSVLTGHLWLEILPRVCVPASVLMGIASGLTSLSIVGLMGGMRHSPEEGLLLQAGTVAFWGSIALFVLAGFLNALSPLSGSESLLPTRRFRRFPGRLLAGLVAAFVALSAWPQIELSQDYRLQTLMNRGEYREALDYLGALDPSRLSPTRPVFPNPYEYEVFAHLGGVFAALTAQDPAWVRGLYLRHLTIRVGHGARLGLPTEFVGILEGLERLPEGRGWIADNREDLTRVLAQQLGYQMEATDRERVDRSMRNLRID